MTESVWQRYRQSSDGSLRDELVVRYLPLVKYVAGRLALGLPPHVEVADLESYGLFGLLDAIARFDESRGIKFETYASTRIRGAILDGLRQQDPAPPVWRERARRLEQAYAEVEAAAGRPATDEEVAARLGISTADLQQWLAEAATLVVLPLDGSRRDEAGEEALAPVVAGIAAPSHDSPEEQVLAADRRRILAEAIQALPEKERLVVTLCYYEDVTAKEVAVILGVTPSRVSQLHSRALLRLRGALSLHSHALR